MTVAYRGGVETKFAYRHYAGCLDNVRTPRRTRQEGKKSSMDDDACLFCSIVAGEIPADRVAETDMAVAFRDLSPQAPTHLLVVPKVHRPTLPELAETHPDHALAMLALARQVAGDEGVTDGYRLVCNNGAGAQQTVFHAHMHVLGGRPFSWPPG
jgi:histidine triad (HIT) family protein